MGKFFSDDVETALQYIYYDNRLRLHRGQEGFDLLVKASEAGDGDAGLRAGPLPKRLSVRMAGTPFPSGRQKGDESDSPFH